MFELNINYNWNTTKAIFFEFFHYNLNRQMKWEIQKKHENKD